AIDINRSERENLDAVSNCKVKELRDITAIIRDRPRHEKLIQEVREAGVRIKLISDGDVAAAINTAFEDTGVDIMLGAGGAPEGVISAVALKCLGGEIQGRVLPNSQEEYDRCLKMGLKDPHQVLLMDDLVRGDDAIFAASGVTDGELLRGVRFKGGRATTHSVVMRAKTGTIRFIQGDHLLALKPNLVMK